MTSPGVERYQSVQAVASVVSALAAVLAILVGVVLARTQAPGLGAATERVSIPESVQLPEGRADLGEDRSVRIDIGVRPARWVGADRAHRATVRPGAHFEVLVEFENTSTEVLNEVAVGATLPDGLILTPATTLLQNGANPRGVSITSNNVATGGIEVGNYERGAHGYVLFEVAVAESGFPCGQSDLPIRAGVQPLAMRSAAAALVLTVEPRC